MDILFHVLVCALVSHVYGQSSPVVGTTIGQVQGLTASDGEYYVYYGIPYAGTTAGDNRFREPTSPPAFEEVFVATNAGVLCAQPGLDGPIGVEDCLVLSVFTKNITSTKPVLVWLIGEEYTTSTPLQHSFGNLVGEDLIVVAVNYRLSVFGFLCLGIEEAPGNVGLKDVLQSLQFIQDNIASFGGDPNNVVLFGHGSGAAMVDLITMSPLAEGLVHKAIFHSGSALAPWAVSYDPIGSAQDFHDIILENRRGTRKKGGGRPGGRPIRPIIIAPFRPYSKRRRQDLVTTLRGATVDELVNAVAEFEFKNNELLFATCIENVELNPNNTFLNVAPIKLLESGEYLHIPVIAGYTDREGSVRAEQAVNGQWLREMEDNFNDFLPPDLELNDLVIELRENITQSIREFYFGNRVINITWVDDYFKYHGDTMTIIPVIRSVIERGRTSTVEVRLLEFSFRGSNNSDWAFEDIELNGVPHGGVLNYLLDFDLLEENIITMVKESLVHRYVSFMNTGNPEYTDNGGATWLPIMRPFQEYIWYAGGETSPGVWVYSQMLMQEPHRSQYMFWNSLYRDYNRVPLPVSAANTMSLSFITLCSIILALL